MNEDAEDLVERIVSVLDRTGIQYMIGGSFASSFYGEPRMTRDVDFVVDLHEEHIPALMANFPQQDWYIDDEMIRDAIQTQSSFNIIFLPTMYKGDFFCRRRDAWGQEEWSRRTPRKVESTRISREIYYASAEGMILQKLLWYRMGGEISTQQWTDIQKMLKQQQPTLDLDYLKKWAQQLSLMDLLERACSEAGVAL
jgi:hypothetical protein